MDDFITRSGSNADLIFGTIAATLVSPTLAVAAAVLSAVYASGKNQRGDTSKNDYSRLKEIVYSAISSHEYCIKKRLLGYGLKEQEADRFLRDVVYEGYIDSLISNPDSNKL
ncbi:MAG: hypothetical protein AABX33_05335 [Nanoarchaeota archaeon]